MIEFPSSLVQLKDNVNRDITFLMKFSTPSSLISLENLKILEDFDISRVGSSFQFNGEIPFDLNSIASTLKTFSFQDSNLYSGLPNLMSFKNVEELSLRNNSIPGELPTCFTCYFINLLMNPDSSFDELDAMSFTHGFSGNKFNNLDFYSDQPPCSKYYLY